MGIERFRYLFLASENWNYRSSAGIGRGGRAVRVKLAEIGEVRRYLGDVPIPYITM